MRQSSIWLLALFLLPQCHNKHDPTPEEQLPPATQTGANTFGCLLNGQPWTPSGNNGVPNYRVTYDPGYAGGNLAIRVYRYINDLKGSQYFLIGGTSISKPAIYEIDGVTCGVYYSAAIKGPCQEYNNTSGLTMRGQLVITRLDVISGIISGTFNFTLAQPGCDTIKVTQGRFDKKL